MSDTAPRPSVLWHYVPDPGAAVDFYSDGLGWPLATTHEEIGWFEFGALAGPRIAVLHWNDLNRPLPTGRGVSLSEVDDLGGYLARLEEAGIHAVRPKKGPLGDVATIHDPWGNYLQFRQRPSTPP